MADVKFSQYMYLSKTHNKQEMAYNAYYAVKYNQISSYRQSKVSLDENGPLEAFNLDLKPLESDLPESMKCLGTLQY